MATGSDPYPDFQLARLDFPLDEPMFAYQLALVWLHPAATERQKERAELQFHRLREKGRATGTIGAYEDAAVAPRKAKAEVQEEEDVKPRLPIQHRVPVQYKEMGVQTDQVVATGTIVTKAPPNLPFERDGIRCETYGTNGRLSPPTHDPSPLRDSHAPPSPVHDSPPAPAPLPTASTSALPPSLSPAVQALPRRPSPVRRVSPGRYGAPQPISSVRGLPSTRFAPTTTAQPRYAPYRPGTDRDRDRDNDRGRDADRGNGRNASRSPPPRPQDMRRLVPLSPPRASQASWTRRSPDRQVRSPPPHFRRSPSPQASRAYGRLDDRDRDRARSPPVYSRLATSSTLPESEPRGYRPIDRHARSPPRPLGPSQRDWRSRSPRGRSASPRRPLGSQISAVQPNGRGGHPGEPARDNMAAGERVSDTRWAPSPVQHAATPSGALSSGSFARPNVEDGAIAYRPTSLPPARGSTPPGTPPGRPRRLGTPPAFLPLAPPQPSAIGRPTTPPIDTIPKAALVVPQALPPRPLVAVPLAHRIGGTPVSNTLPPRPSTIPPHPSTLTVPLPLSERISAPAPPSVFDDEVLAPEALTDSFVVVWLSFSAWHPSMTLLVLHNFLTRPVLGPPNLPGRPRLPPLPTPVALTWGLQGNAYALAAYRTRQQASLVVAAVSGKSLRGFEGASGIAVVAMVFEETPRFRWRDLADEVKTEWEDRERERERQSRSRTTGGQASSSGQRNFDHGREAPLRADANGSERGAAGTRGSGAVAAVAAVAAIARTTAAGTGATLRTTAPLSYERPVRLPPTQPLPPIADAPSSPSEDLVISSASVSNNAFEPFPFPFPPVLPSKRDLEGFDDNDDEEDEREEEQVAKRLRM